MSPESSKWIKVYFPVSWLTQFGHGLVTTVVGPTQPYLAENTGVDIATINLVWTFGFFGYMVGSLATSFIFKEYMKSDKAKLVFLAATKQLYMCSYMYVLLYVIVSESSNAF